MDTLLDVFQDGLSADSSAGLSYEESLSYDTIFESVQNLKLHQVIGIIRPKSELGTI